LLIVFLLFRTFRATSSPDSIQVPPWEKILLTVYMNYYLF